MSDEALLKLLEAHGHQFLQSFDTPVVLGKRKDVPQKPAERGTKKIKFDEDFEEEEEAWEGIRSDSEQEDVNGEDSPENAGDDDGEDEDDDFTFASHSHQPDIVVFSEASTSSAVARQSKSGFMSSKVTKLMQDVSKTSHKKATSDEDEDDLSNAQNDALLHRLVHTQLLSGSLNQELNMAPAQRKKALAGRIMEVAGKVKLGKGETTVRKAEHNRAAKHVRDGLFEKQKERQQKQLEEAKQLGNYHPKLKALYDASETSKPQYRKRERGMKMGVGSFKGGILKLGKNEISVVESRGNSSRGRGRGGHRRGGKR